MLNVVCVKHGSLYGADYVNNLHAAVSRHLSLPHRFVCFTDDWRGLNCQAEELPRGLSGWWNKLALFRHKLFHHPVLYFDLDTVIVGSLDQIAAYSGPFAILRDFYRPDGWQSAVMAWNGDHSHLWAKFLAAGCPGVEGGDQAWIEQQLGFEPDIWQDKLPGQFVSYKVDCFYAPPPDVARVVCFHGLPRPHDVKRKWVRDAWRTF